MKAQPATVFAVRAAGASVLRLEAQQRDDLEIGVFLDPSFDYDIETLKGVARLRERRGGTFHILNLGGLRIRGGDELVAWLEERRVAGIVGFHASLAGYGEIHDRWNGRVGDFDYQTSILPLAGERGMIRQEKLTEDDRDRLPEHINRLRAKKFNNWLSEREWIPIMLETVDRTRKLLLKLDVDEANIDYLQKCIL